MAICRFFDMEFRKRSLHFMANEPKGSTSGRMHDAVTRRKFLGTTLVGGVTVLTGGFPKFMMAATDEVKTTFAIGGDLNVNRLGYGAMQITGQGVWGWPSDRENALKVLRRAIELGVNLIDTADAYGPEVSELLIAEALHPYPRDLAIATKGGLMRPGPGQWKPNGRPEYLTKCVEGSLKRLRLERIDLYQLHRIDPKVPVEDSLGALKKRSEEHTSELQSRLHLVCRLLLER